jgi:hypothetical protein
MPPPLEDTTGDYADVTKMHNGATTICEVEFGPTDW